MQSAPMPTLPATAAPAWPQLLVRRAQNGARASAGYFRTLWQVMTGQGPDIFV